MKDRLSLAVDHILGEESDFTPPNFIDCEGEGVLSLPGNLQITCEACKGFGTRRGYINA
jgi:hypothetical protein